MARAGTHSVPALWLYVYGLLFGFYSHSGSNYPYLISNLGFNQFGAVKFYNEVMQRDINTFSAWLENKHFPINSFIVFHSTQGAEFTAIGVYTQSFAWVFLVYSYDGYYKMWINRSGNKIIVNLTDIK